MNKKFLALLVITNFSAYSVFAQQAIVQTQINNPPVLVCPHLKTYLSRGATDKKTNGEVSLLQRFLKDNMHLTDQQFLVTGNYGKVTQLFVKVFQRQNKLVVTGAVAGATRNKIASLCGDMPLPAPVPQSIPNSVTDKYNSLIPTFGNSLGVTMSSCKKGTQTIYDVSASGGYTGVSYYFDINGNDLGNLSSNDTPPFQTNSSNINISEYICTVLKKTKPEEVKTSSKYKDGDYNFTQNYCAPGGKEKMGVDIVLKNDKITSASVTNLASGGIDHGYLQGFVDAITPKVVGMNITGLSLDVVAGASYVTRGFNEALKRVRGEQYSDCSNASVNPGNSNNPNIITSG